jgi:hypothetical protein
VIIESKRSTYNKQISASQNRIITTWDITKCETRQRMESAKINNSEIDSKTFNNYFVRFAEKYSVVKPVYCIKKGDKKYEANYRSNSLLSSFAKVMEKVIFIRLLAHFNNNNIIASDNLDFSQIHQPKKLLLTKFMKY